MNINEIKKELYKQKPVATFQYALKGEVYYHAELYQGERPIVFKVPISDMGDTKFQYEMESQLLIRYIAEL